MIVVLTSKIRPNLELIKQTLTSANISSLDTLFVAYSHSDHIMDNFSVVQLLGGKMYGSVSTLNMGRGAIMNEI